ncbi:MAG TPA: SWIM zinc finger family protein [Pyrinomonadaceae bacterium]|jgi:hypothetical protein|nr:SWIM zinc finger family protein [Pyrinomonadaceae bacterium]
MEERELKALQIAAKSKLTRKGKNWLVPSQSIRGAQYTVKPDPIEPLCSCPDFESRKQRCKHIFAVEYTIEREQIRRQSVGGQFPLGISHGQQLQKKRR